jgi:hypothetical protein
MSFNWNEYFDLAQELAGIYATGPFPRSGTASQEAKCRCAISRAYYAAFIRARNHLIFVDGDPNVPADATAHAYIRQKFRHSRDRRRKRIAALLDILRAARNRADYDNAVPGLVANTSTHLTFAHQVLNLLDNL